MIEKLLRNSLFNEFRTLWQWRRYKPLNCVPHGHFYSPIVSKYDIDSFEKQVSEDQSNDSIAGIEMNLNEQLFLLKEFSKYYTELPFSDYKSDSNRYYYCNDTFKYTDAIILYSFIRNFKPVKIIEIGSGFSSALMLDTRDLLFPDLELTFIEPNPKLLYSNFKDDDERRCKIFKTKVQNIPLEEFRSLKENDFLFIDSSHVSKAGSDVNFEIFRILPILNPGVLIHFHDIFYPFEYPKEWVYEGRNWNEDYLIRAFLSYNDKFKIVLFSHYIHNKHPDAFSKMPLTYKNSGGSLWIRKI